MTLFLFHLKEKLIKCNFGTRKEYKAKRSKWPCGVETGFHGTGGKGWREKSCLGRISREDQVLQKSGTAWSFSAWRHEM